MTRKEQLLIAMDIFSEYMNSKFKWVKNFNQWLAMEFEKTEVTK